MSTTTQNQSSSTPPNPATPAQTAALPYGSGDAAYAPALAYAVVAQLMGTELQLSSMLKKIQADETQDSMKSAADQASETRSSATADSIGQSVAGTFSVAQGASSIGAESYLSGSQGVSRSKQNALKEKLADHESRAGASNSPTALKSHTDTKLKLQKEIQEHEDNHKAQEHKKNAFHAAIQSIGQLPQVVSKAGSGIEKSGHDAEASLDQANQQAYKQVADEMSSSNQAALSTINQFTNENFAAATAIRG